MLGAPAWAARNPAVPSSPPRDPADYAAFLTALIGRYGPAGLFWQAHPELRPQPIRRWQIWLADWGDGLLWMTIMVLCSTGLHTLRWTPAMAMVIERIVARSRHGSAAGRFALSWADRCPRDRIELM